MKENSNASIMSFLFKFWIPFPLQNQHLKFCELIQVLFYLLEFLKTNSQPIDDFKF